LDSISDVSGCTLHLLICLSFIRLILISNIIRLQIARQGARPFVQKQEAVATSYFTTLPPKTCTALAP